MNKKLLLFREIGFIVLSFLLPFIILIIVFSVNKIALASYDNYTIIMLDMESEYIAYLRNLKQILFCPYGRIQLILENKNGREEIELSDPSIGVVIEECTWREMLWLQKDSVLCVAASELYDPEDYIRDYDEFRKYISEQV